MRDRDNLNQSIKELTTEKDTLEEKWQKSLDNYAQLLEAKDIERKNFEQGVEKLIKFKNQVKDLLQNQTAQIAQSNKEIDAYATEVKKLNLTIEKLHA